MRRRQVLAGGAALLSVPLAGCGHPPVVLDMTEATASDITDRVTLRADPRSDEYTVLRSAVENGTATRTGRYELFDRTNTVRYNNSVYEVSETQLSSSEVTVYDVRIDLNPTETTAERGTIAYEELPAVDRRRLGGILTAEAPPDNDGYDVGTGYGSAAEVGTGSVFVPDQQYDILIYEGNRYRVDVEAETAPQAAYRYEVSEVATTIEAFAESVRAQYLFTLTGLTAAEREVVTEAVETGGYYEDTEAFQSVGTRIRDYEGLTVDDSYGTWLLEYEGTNYLTYVEW